MVLTTAIIRAAKQSRLEKERRFEIKLDSPFAVFHGEPHESDPAIVSGTLVLSNPDSLNVRSIKIRLQGKWRVSWFVEPAVSTLQIRDRGMFFMEEHTLYPAEGVSSAVAHKIAPGIHEFRFQFNLTPDLPESVEGLPGSFVVYSLIAEIDPGMMMKNMTVTKHLRVIRTLGRDIMDTVPIPYSNEDVWRDKVWYRIYLPTRYYIFGTSVTAEFTLCPLNKGVTIGKIKMEVIERVTLNTDQGRFKTRQSDHVVASHEQDMPQNSLEPLTEETSGIADQSFHFKVTCPLERSLNQSRQTVDTEHIKVWHNLKIYINLHNPDGHVSQLLVRNLLHIYISPNLPIGEDQMMTATPPQVQEVSEAAHAPETAPPMYGSHQLDQLYDDVDPAAYVSGSQTPYQSNLSRAGSNEDLRSSFAQITVTDSENASRLQSRLEDLQARPHHDHPSNRGSSIPTISDDQSSYMQSRHSASTLPASADSSRPQSPSVRVSDHSRPISETVAGPSSGAPQQSSYFTPYTYQTSLHPASANSTAFYDPVALNRVPSYSTAVRTPLGSPRLEGLPSYETAVSRPTSPILAPGARSSQQDPMPPLPSPSFPPPPPPVSTSAPTISQTIAALRAASPPPAPLEQPPPLPNITSIAPPQRPPPTLPPSAVSRGKAPIRPVSVSSVPDPKPTYLGLPPGLARPRPAPTAALSATTSTGAIDGRNSTADAQFSALNRTETSESTRRRAHSDVSRPTVPHSQQQQQQQSPGNASFLQPPAFDSSRRR